MFRARINRKSNKEQSVKEHLSNVAVLSRKFGQKASLSETAELVGVLHDMGKYTKCFNTYIEYVSNNPEDKSLRGKIDHSTAGAKYIYDKYYHSLDPYQKITAQIVALTIYSHHGGLRDCLDLNGVDKFTERMTKDLKGTSYEEALNNFKSDWSECYIEELFVKAVEEIKSIFEKLKVVNEKRNFHIFATGMLVKYLYSCVIDADRFDTQNFMEGKGIQDSYNKEELWDELSNLFWSKLENYPRKSRIDKLRNEISIRCKEFAENKPGVYRLSVPTGGGKTFSSFGYSLEHAKKFKKDRIIYVIPFTTIIDQNAKDIKEIIERAEVVLEHHSNVIIDNKEEDYKLLTERWDSPIVLTTMVQFLETFFSSGTQAVRRLHSLADSVIIFDEIQAIPTKCISMFNSIINFLSAACSTTVILCTATQPLLSETKMPLRLDERPDIITDIYNNFIQFKRVNLTDQRINGGYTTHRLKDFIIKKMEKQDSLLTILNTKSSAKRLFDELKHENEFRPPTERYIIYHLSTNMCPSHRLSKLKEINEKLGKEKVICVSTQLIEAGINISFECVVRSLAGLDSITQAAGRCNRHGEQSIGDVYIINDANENVSKLVDIKHGQLATERILNEFKENPSIFDNDLLSPKLMEKYYKYYYQDRSIDMDYRLPKLGNARSMYKLLSDNAESVDAYAGINGSAPSLLLRQSFKTAGEYFRVIDQNTTTVLVPYGEGVHLINLINGTSSIYDLNAHIKKAQAYSVNLFEGEKIRLQEMGAIVGLKDNVILALREGFYCEDVGVTLERQKMILYNY